jgi:hypothetical protein
MFVTNSVDTFIQILHIQGVHSAGLSDVREASQNAVSGDTKGFPGKLMVIHSVIT